MSRGEHKPPSERRNTAVRHSDGDSRATPRRGRGTRGTERLGSLPEILSLRDFLSTLGENPPTVHINGPGFPFALLTVDFGQGRNSRPPQELHDDILVRIRAAGRAISANNADTVRVHMDNSHGVWWVSL